MSNLKPTSNIPITLTPTLSNNPTNIVHCKAQITEACEYRGGYIEFDRPIRKNTRYCYDCAYEIKRQKSAKWKSNKRKEIGWKAYQETYSPYPTKADKQKYHRDYVRKWRTRKKLESDTQLIS